mgnify:CR=1 FL=1
MEDTEPTLVRFAVGGPRTKAGKATSSKNATKHGLTAKTLVLPKFESAEEFEKHRLGIIAALAPTGALEAELVERVASITWRMRRVAVAETAAVALAQESALMLDRTPERTETVRAAIPSGSFGENVARYEAHLQRQLATTLALLERVRLSFPAPAFSPSMESGGVPEYSDARA